MKILEYIKANGEYYTPQEPGVQDPKKIEGVFYPACYIKKLWFGRWQVDIYDDFAQYHIHGSSTLHSNQKPNTRIILYPAGIEEIKYYIQ